MSGVAAIVGGPIITHDNSPNSPNDDREANGLDQTANDVQGTCWTRFTHSFKSTIFSTNTVISCFGLEVIGDNHSHRRQSRRLKKKRKGEVGPNGRSIPLITTASMNNGYNNGIHNSGEETHAPPQPGQAANATLNLGQDAETPRRTTSNRLRKSRRRKQTSMIRGAINNGGLTNEGGSTAAGEVSQPGRQTPILLPLSSPTGSRNLTPTTTPILEQLVLWSSQLRKPVEPFPIHLPDDVLRTIFEFAAADLDTACALCLVACHVKVWVDRILYRRERVLLFFRDILRDTILILFACANVVELETSGDFLRRTGVGASVELTQSTPSSVLPATAPGTPANTIPSAVFTASTSIPTSNIAGAGLISLGSGPNAFPHTGSLINAAISAGIGIGDTISAVGGNDNSAATNDDHSSQSLTPNYYTPGPPTPTPANISLGNTPGAINADNDGEEINGPPGSNVVPTSNSTEMLSTLHTAGASSTPVYGVTNTRTSILKAFPMQQWLQLEQATLRPRYLTLVPPTLNVNFKLPILSNVTHLHYSAALPRALNAFGVGEGLNFDPATGGVNVAGSSTGRGTSLQLLTHVAFDYPLGVTGVKAETLLVLVRSALDVGKPLGWENEGQLLDESDSKDGNNGPEGDTDPFLESNENRQEGSGNQTPPLESETPRRRLKMVIVRILLRPRMKPDKDRTSEVWRQLSDLAARDERLVFFESPGLFGEDIWEKANAIVAARDEGRLSTSWYRESP
ncbi:hypothetical protein FRC15_006027 [Serendipita sp. 397]|nr:hypothetical protein FRC15_006027 [Serendipita sp. 397]